MGLLISKVISPRIGQIQKEINEANAKINQDLQGRLKGSDRKLSIGTRCERRANRAENSF